MTISAKFRIIADQVKAACLWAKGRVLLLVLIALGVSVPLWLLEHDARLRRDFELQQIRHQAAAEIANLRARAAAALDDADSSAQRVRDLEARRLQLERAEANLKSEISNLKAQERAHLQEVAALPFPALVEELRRELGPGSFGTRDSQPTRDSSLATRQLPAASSRLPEQATDSTRSAGNSKLQIQDSRSANPQSRVPNSEFRVPNPESRIPVRPAGGPNPESSAPNHESRVPSPGLFLTEPGARAVASALIERDACREESLAKDGLLTNCEQRGAASRAVIDEMTRSVLSLKEAVRLKDEIQSRSEAVHRAELKAARGSRLRRFGRALQYVGAGVVIGVVVAQ